MAAIPVPADVTTSTGASAGSPSSTSRSRALTTPASSSTSHGGAYAIGTAASSIGLASDLARRAGARLVTVDYRLAPEHPHPAAIDDAVAAYRGLLDSGVAASAIAIAGESAGAGLAAATLVALKQVGLPQPSGALLMSPWADLTLSGEHQREGRGRPRAHPRRSPPASRRLSGRRRPKGGARQPDLRRPHRAATAADPGRLTRDPPRRRHQARRPRRRGRRRRQARSHTRRSRTCSKGSPRCSTKATLP
jgi:acetyl esterase/lipase